MSREYPLRELVRFIDRLWGIEQDEPKRPELKIVHSSDDPEKPFAMGGRPQLKIVRTADSQ